MGACRIHVTTDRAVILHDDTLIHFIDTARAADRGDADAIEALPSSAVYVADQLALLIEPDLAIQAARLAAEHDQTGRRD